MEHKPIDQSTLTRLALCAVIAAAAVFAAEKLCEGKPYPLWEAYGPWLKENKVQAIAIGAILLYAASLVLLPDQPPQKPEEPGYEPC